MDHRDSVRAGIPADRLAIHIESSRSDAPVFDAALALRRRELTRGAAAGLAVRYPAANLRVLALIYGHAIGLKLAGARVYAHPGPHQLPQGESR
jgi:uncharacterized protein